MKKLCTLALILPLLLLKLTAQDVKSQTEEILDLKVGVYTPYLADWDGQGNYSGGIDDLAYKVTSVEDYKATPSAAHKEVYMVIKGSKTNPDKHKLLMYIPDNEAFPITYMQRVYEGNKKMQKEIGYVPRTDVYNDERAVFLDGKIYLIDNWKSKNDYNLKAIMEFQEKKLKGLRMMKEVMKSPKKMKADKPHEKLQNYLDTASEKQTKAYATWIKEPGNKSIVENKKLLSELINEAIKKFNDDYKKSDVWKRIQENNRRAEAAAAENDVTIKNNTGKDIYLYEEGSMNGSLIRANSSNTFNCKKTFYYTFSHSSGTRHGAAGPLAYSANSSCGGTSTVN